MKVPAFTHPRLLGAPITESLDITRLIHQRFYPHLCPKEHQLEIEKLLGQLHQIIFVTLSFRKWPERREQIINGAKSKLKDPNLSQRHREALEYKVSQ
jgi:glutathione S-transferase